MSAVLTQFGALARGRSLWLPSSWCHPHPNQPSGPLSAFFTSGLGDPNPKEAVPIVNPKPTYGAHLFLSVETTMKAILPPLPEDQGPTLATPSVPPTAGLQSVSETVRTIHDLLLVTDFLG